MKIVSGCFSSAEDEYESSISQYIENEKSKRVERSE